MAEIVGTPEIFPENKVFLKSIAVTHVLLYTCLFPLCVLEQNKKDRGKKANWT